VEFWVPYSVRGGPLMRQMRAHEWGTRHANVNSSHMSTRTCIFCESPDVSLEHVWPKWLLKLLPDRRPLRQKLIGRPESTFTGDFKIKCVCTTCNNGWMSDLERDSQHVMSLLAQDISIILEPKYQTLIAEWALKIAILLEATKPKDFPKFFDANDRKAFRLKRTFPNSVHIWAGRYADSGLFGGAADFGYFIRETGASGTGSVSTMVIGRLVLQVVAVKFPDDHPSVQVPMRASNWHLSLIQIYPKSDRTLTWPPVHSFHNQGGPLSLSELKYRWNPTDDGSSEPHL